MTFTGTEMMFAAGEADETPRLAQTVISHLGIATVDEPLSPLLTAAGCYDHLPAPAVLDTRRGP